MRELLLIPSKMQKIQKKLLYDNEYFYQFLILYLQDVLKSIESFHLTIQILAVNKRVQSKIFFYKY